MNTKKIVTYVALAAIALISVFWVVKIFTGDKESQSGVTLSSGLSGDIKQISGIASAEDPFITLLSGIRDVDLDNRQLLSYPIFVNGLRDLSRTVSDRGRGRENPFAPIGTGNLNLGGFEDQGSLTGEIFETATSSEAVISSEDEPETKNESEVKTESEETTEEAVVE